MWEQDFKERVFERNLCLIKSGFFHSKKFTPMKIKKQIGLKSRACFFMPPGHFQFKRKKP